MQLDEESLSPSFQDTNLSKGPFGVFQLSSESPETVSFNGSSDKSPNVEAISALGQIDAEPCWDENLLTLDLSLGPVLDAQTENESWGDGQFEFPVLFPSVSGPMDLPSDAWELLSYYRDRVVPLLSPLNSAHHKSPWNHLILPTAMNVLAEKSMGGTVTAMRSALLNAILATSAFHRRVSGGEYWQVTAEDYEKKAQHDLLHGFQKEVGSATKRVKYKEVLMALVNLATLSVRFPCHRSSHTIEFDRTSGFPGRTR